MKEKTINGTTGPKIRVDSWAAKLTPEQQWKLFRKATQCADWIMALDWAKEEFHLDLSPSHSSFYSWMATMRRLECEQRMEEIAIASSMAATLGKKTPKEETLIAAFKTLALDAAVARNPRAAGTYAKIAETLQTLGYKKFYFEQKKDDILEEKRRRDAKVNLTDEEHNAKIREILGMKTWD